MKLWHPTRDTRFGHRRWGEYGFTLSEVMVASAIFMMVVGGVVATNIFGLRMIELTEPKQQAAQRARELINLLSDDISTGWLVKIGTEGPDGFTPAPHKTIKEGNALKVWADSQDPDYFVVYYVDTAGDVLLRYTSTAPVAEVVAWGVTNDNVFTGEFFDKELNQWGTLADDRTSMVVGVVLEFSELERTGTPLGPAQTYKSYQFQTRLKWRAR